MVKYSYNFKTIINSGSLLKSAIAVDNHYTVLMYSQREIYIGGMFYALGILSTIGI